MENQVATIEHGLSFDQMKERASLLVKSGFLPSAINTTEKALTIMMTGMELGLGFMESLRSINVIQGKPAMAAQLLLGLCHRTKQVEQAYFKEETDTRVVFVLKRKGSPHYESVFTMEDARRLGLAEKDNYKKQPKTMLSWRAISKACRVMFPDAICGLYTPEELAEGVDVQEDAVTHTAEVKEIHTKPVDQNVEAIKNNMPSTEGAAGLTNPMEVDRIGSTYLKPPYDTQFPDKNIMEIYGTTTPGGHRKGHKFLEMIAQHSKDGEEKATVQKFLELMAVEA